MHKTELCTHVAASASVPRATADAVVSALFSTIGEAPARNETVAIASVGTFTTRSRAAREGRIPATGERIAIAASKAPAFKAAKKLHETVNAGE